MSNRIVTPSGEPAAPKPPNVREMIEEARFLYDRVEDGVSQRRAFHKLCDAMHLISQGIARSFHDNERRDAEMKEIRERITPK